MGKKKWSNLFGTVLAGTTIATVMTASKHVAKKYGQKINNQKLFDINYASVIDYAFKRFINTDDDEILESVDKIENITTKENNQ